jgi:hypothetical protein
MKMEDLNGSKDIHLKIAQGHNLALIVLNLRGSPDSGTGFRPTGRLWPFV